MTYYLKNLLISINFNYNFVFVKQNPKTGGGKKEIPF